MNSNRREDEHNPHLSDGMSTFQRVTFLHPSLTDKTGYRGKLHERETEVRSLRGHARQWMPCVVHDREQNAVFLGGP